MANLRQLARRVGRWTVPEGIQQVGWNAWYAWRTRNRPGHRYRRLALANRRLKDRHAGERCFIIATGPSIKTQDLSCLSGETCIAVSNFFVHPDYVRIKPRYHCLAPFHEPITEDAWQQWLDDLDAKTPGTALLLGLADYERNRRGGRFADRELWYVRFGGTLAGISTHGVDLTQSIPGPQSVSTMALMAAVYMGFKKIYLLGCDHDWILHINVSSHFYDEKQHALNRAGFREFTEWDEPDFAMHCRRYVALWDEYKAVRAAARLSGAEIYNATPGGLLDVFPRARLETVLDPVASAPNRS